MKLNQFKLTMHAKNVTQNVTLFMQKCHLPYTAEPHTILILKHNTTGQRINLEKTQ